MLYFIPAWYKQNTWSENEQNWHIRRGHSEFDDTVKQIQLFHRNATYPYQIMLLSFSPNFRHFLHRQGVYHALYWSCFDAIQEIERKKARLVSVHNLNWPKEIEFVYTPFVLVAMLHNKKYAQVEYGEDGNPIQIDMFEDGKIVRRNIYDDRGFVAATIIYEKEVAIYQDYLMENGIRKLRYFFDDGHVEINPRYPNYLIQFNNEKTTIAFRNLNYSSIDQVIIEVTSAFVQQTTEKDIFCAAMYEGHSSVVKNTLLDKKLILSFFGDRYCFSDSEDECALMKQAKYVITDSPEHTQFIQDKISYKINHITDITPYDTRIDSGISQQLAVQKILVPIDHMEDDLLEKMIVNLGNYCNTNKNARICLFTRDANYNRKQIILNKTRDFLKNAKLPEEWAMEETLSYQAENDLDRENDIPVRFVVEQCVEELAVSKCMKEQRVIVDLRAVPELYLQIMAVSIGIPQILWEENKFAQNGENSYIIPKLSVLSKALEFYLDNLANWNAAQVSSYKLGKKYTTGVLLAKWKEVIESIE